MLAPDVIPLHIGIPLALALTALWAYLSWRDHMTAKHADPEYRTNARIVRAQVTRARRFGDTVICQRCGREITETQAFDVGHVDEHAGHSIANLGPEHRHRIDCPARGNRSHGGRLGAAITNARRGARTNTRRLAW